MTSKLYYFLLNLIPRRRQWNDWSLPSKLTAISAALAILPILFGIIGFGLNLFWTDLYKSELKVNIKEGSSASITFFNLGNYELEIFDVDSEVFYKCYLIIDKDLDDIEGYFFNEIGDAVNFEKNYELHDANHLILSPKESWTREITTKPTNNDTVCSFYIDYVYQYKATSFWIESIRYFYKALGIINPKNSFTMKYDGCIYQQIGRRKISEEEFDLQKSLLHLKTMQCIDNTYPSIQKLRSKIISDNTEASEYNKNLISDFSDEKIAAFAKFIFDKINSSSDNDLVNLCEMLSVVYFEMNNRSDIAVISVYENKDSLLYHCLTRQNPL